MIYLRIEIVLLVVLLALFPSGASAQEVSSIEHDLFHGAYNSFIQLDADTFVLAYSSDNQTGFIKSFTISADGSNISERFSLEHDPIFAESNSLVQVDPDTVALAYYSNIDIGLGNETRRGIIKTFTIPADGSTISQVGFFEYDAGSAVHSNSLIQVDADTYALAYSGADSDGFIKTFTISANGSTIDEEMSLEHDLIKGNSNSLVQVNADTYALAYSGADSDGFIKTFTISANGSTITEKTSIEHDLIMGGSNSLIQIDADTFALAYQGASFFGYLKSFTISADGSSISEEEATLIAGTSAAGFSLVQVDIDSSVISYGTVGGGIIETYDIPADGVSLSLHDSLIHDTRATVSSLVRVDADTYALAYQGPDFDGFIATFAISVTGNFDWIFSDGFDSGDISAWSAAAKRTTR